MARWKWTGLWQHADFLRLWSGQTISVFGSMVGGTAMSFTAILFLHATPFQMGLFGAMQLVPAFLTGLFAGAWVDRLRRRPLMIGADIGRALVLASIPLAAIFGVLHITQVYAVALLVSILTILFDLSYQTYLPGLVGKEHVVEGNSKLSASAAVSEFAGFSIGGWLVQIFTAPFAILIDAFSFIVSAITIGLIRAPEQAVAPEEQPDMRREIREGLHAVWNQPLLRVSAAAILIDGLTGGFFNALVVLYMVHGIGFDPGVLGMIWAVGGISSFAGAALSPRISRRFGFGPTMIGGLFVSGLSHFLIVIASGPTILSAILMIIQQMNDGFYVIYEINLISLRQGIVAGRMLGRVNATMRFLALGATLIGTLTGGLLGDLAGVRLVLFVASFGTLIAALVLGLSQLRHLREAPLEAPLSALPAAEES